MFNPRVFYRVGCISQKFSFSLPHAHEKRACFLYTLHWLLSRFVYTSHLLIPTSWLHAIEGTLICLRGLKAPNKQCVKASWGIKAGFCFSLAPLPQVCNLSVICVFVLSHFYPTSAKEMQNFVTENCLFWKEASPIKKKCWLTHFCGCLRHAVYSAGSRDPQIKWEHE